MDLISYKDFKKLDIRVVQVLKADMIPGKTKILKLIVDIGFGEIKTMIAGGAEFYTPESFLNKKFVAIVNLESKSVAGLTSQGMLLAADVGGKPLWLVVEEAQVGAKII